MHPLLLLPTGVLFKEAEKQEVLEVEEKEVGDLAEKVNTQKMEIKAASLFFLSLGAEGLESDGYRSSFLCMTVQQKCCKHAYACVHIAVKAATGS